MTIIRKYQSFTLSAIAHVLALVLILNIPNPLRYSLKEKDRVEDVIFSVDLVYTERINTIAPPVVPEKQNSVQQTQDVEEKNSKVKTAPEEASPEVETPKQSPPKKSAEKKPRKKNRKPKDSSKAIAVVADKSTKTKKNIKSERHTTKAIKKPQKKTRLKKNRTRKISKPKIDKALAVQQQPKKPVVKETTKNVVETKSSRKNYKQRHKSSSVVSKNRSSKHNPTHTRLHTNKSSSKNYGKPSLAYIPPKPRKVFRPPYPQSAQRRNITGKVTLLLEISKNGLVTHVQVVKSSSHTLLDKSAMKTAYEWQFWPATLGSQKVAGKIKVPISFHL